MERSPSRQSSFTTQEEHLHEVLHTTEKTTGARAITEMMHTTKTETMGDQETMMKMLFTTDGHDAVLGLGLDPTRLADLVNAIKTLMLLVTAHLLNVASATKTRVHDAPTGSLWLLHRRIEWLCWKDYRWICLKTTFASSSPPRIT